jgi:dihydrofolate reductase
MTKVFSALATSADGYITGPNPNPDQPLGLGGSQLFDWYTDGDTPSTQFTDFRMSAASRPVFDALAARTGAVIAGRTTYDHSRGWGGRGPHPHAPQFVLSHRPPPPGSDDQTFIAAGIAEAIEAAAHAAGGKDVALMGSGMIAAALRAGLLDEVTIHQVPVLLGGGVALFASVPTPVQLTALGVVAAPGVTHLHYSAAG